MRLLEGAGLLLFLPLSVALILRALVWDYTVMKPPPVRQEDIIAISTLDQNCMSLMLRNFDSRVSVQQRLTLCEQIGEFNSTD